MKSNHTLALGALMAGIAIGCGAFGAHGLTEQLEAAGHLDTWHTGVRYQMWHALALILVGIVHERRKLSAFIPWSFLIGSVLFSGSIYCLSLGIMTKVMGPLTPLGGALLILGWIALSVGAWFKPLADH